MRFRTCLNIFLLSPLGQALPRNGQMSPMKRGKCRKATKGARPPRRRRWQTKSDGEGASAAEAKWILRAERAKDERGLSR